jgi:Lon protease-like protein
MNWSTRLGRYRPTHLGRLTIYTNEDEMKLPLFPLDVVLFPGAPLPLHIFESRYKELINECLEQKAVFGIIRSQSEGLAVIGCTARILRVLERFDDGRMHILCEGVDRFEIDALDATSRSFLEADVSPVIDDGPIAPRGEREKCTAMHYEVLELVGLDPQSLSLNLDQPISFQLAWTLPADLNFKQELLSLRSDQERTKLLIDYYSTILPKLRNSAEATRRASRNGHVM